MQTAHKDSDDLSAHGPRFDPYLRLIEAIFAGAYGNHPMMKEERIMWMQEHLPKTYAMLAASRHWPTLTDGD